MSTTRQDSADATARAHGIGQAYGDYRELIAAPEVELVVVTTRVPDHYELAAVAIEAGKMVYCEWPLGNGLSQAVELEALAREQRAITVVGLQARASPVIHQVRDLVRDGYVGKVLSTTLIGSGGLWGAMMSSSNAYCAEKGNGATLLTIPFGHAVDALCLCLGDFDSVTATMRAARGRFTVTETGTESPMTAEDQVVASGTLQNGAVASVHYRGGTSRGSNLRWEIIGTDGELIVTGKSGHMQITELELHGAQGNAKSLTRIPVPDDGLQYLGAAANVARLYAQFADDRRTGRATTPSFTDGLIRHRLLDRVQRAAEQGN